MGIKGQHQTAWKGVEVIQSGAIGPVREVRLDQPTGLASGAFITARPRKPWLGFMWIGIFLGHPIVLTTSLPPLQMAWLVGFRHGSHW